ncbi:MAG: hypothetical protein IJR24_03590 [Alloprevotella sp.]|nr:hypothetical protein [Alloprevotella sp.]
MNQQQQPATPEQRVHVLGHYETLTEALAIAMAKCLVWRETDEGTPYSIKELFAFAQKHDRENPLRPEQFYMVSREGAIGISPGLEWMTVWIFIPMEPCRERDFALRNMLEEYHTETEVEEALEKAVTEGLAREKAAKAAAAQAAVRPQAPVPPPTLGLATPPPPAPPMPRR